MKARWLGLLLMVVACDEAAQGPDTTPDAGNTPVFTGGPTTGTVPVPASGDAGLGGSTAGSLPTGTTGTAPAASASGLPCDVEAVVKAKCWTCHSDASNPAKSFGGVVLSKQSGFTAASTIAGNTVAARVKVRINAAAGATPSVMPPVNQPQLTAAEKATLTAWIDKGAPAATAACTSSATTPNDATGATNGTPATTGPSNVPAGYNDPYSPPDSECDYIYELRAHGGQSPTDTTPYVAPTGGDHYEIFYFTPPWKEKVHVTRIEPIIDNAAVLHHWLLYQEEGNASGSGTHKSDTGLQSGAAALLSGWAPGNDSLPIPRHVGLQTITGSSRYGIELHYNTSANPPNRNDRSGARLCLTKTLREHEASVHWLGTQAIVLLPGINKSATGICTPMVTGGTSHIIAHSPHMHKMGRHAKTTVKRKMGGKEEVLWDAPFSFDDQQIFPVKNADREQLIYPGDVLTTTCTYEEGGTNTFGPGTSQEMCYNFVVAWPAGSLSNGSTGIVGGKNTCIDPGT
jgi:hypothetical protein